MTTGVLSMSLAGALSQPSSSNSSSSILMPLPYHLLGIRPAADNSRVHGQWHPQVLLNVGSGHALHHQSPCLFRAPERGHGNQLVVNSGDQVGLGQLLLVQPVGADQPELHDVGGSALNLGVE